MDKQYKALCMLPSSGLSWCHGDGQVLDAFLNPMP